MIAIAGCAESSDTALSRLNAAQEAYDVVDAKYQEECSESGKLIAALEGLSHSAEDIANVEQRKVEFEQRKVWILEELATATSRLDEAKRLLKEAESR